LSAESQEGPAPVTDDAAGEEADPRRGGTAGTPSSDAAGSSSGKTTPDSLTICWFSRFSRFSRFSVDECLSYYKSTVMIQRVKYAVDCRF